MHYLALDVGRKHTGVSYYDSDIEIVFPLDTIHHENDEELIEAASQLVTEREITTIILGLPLMPSGEEGEEVEHVRAVSSWLQEAHPQCEIAFLDERETSKFTRGEESQDPHARAAMVILETYLKKNHSA